MGGTRRAQGTTSGRGRRSIVATATAAVLIGGGLFGVAPAEAAGCVQPVNPIVCENSRPGDDPAEWDVVGAGDPTIHGFATDISVDAGQRIDFKILTDAAGYTVDVYRLGYYGGDGARRVASVAPAVDLPQTQGDCLTDPATGLFDCGTWDVSASWDVPATAVSGVYVAKLRRTDTGGASHVTFVVRDDDSTADLFFQTSDATWQAYNDYGGSSFYSGGANGRAYKLSYNRPFSTRNVINGRDFLFSNEYPAIRFLERNGYDVSYTTNVDTDRRGHLLTGHRVFLSVGHDEYWTGLARRNVEAARDAGVSLAFLSGNEVYWRTRLEPSTDEHHIADRTLVCYKETWADTDALDPTAEWTGTFRDPRFTPPATGGGDPENGLTGTAYMSNNVDLPIQVPYRQSRLRLWRNSTVAQTPVGGTATLAPHTVGYESNEDLDNGFRPAGLFRLSTTTGTTPEYLRDFGSVVSPGTTTHHLTLYRAPSGALVFSAGTIQWAWGLDETHDGVAGPADPAMRQAMVNLFADMGAQPATLMSGLDPATASTDTLAPAVEITSPVAGTTVTNGDLVTVSGTASDNGGGRVAGVEVSTDSGQTWHPATGTGEWSYSFHAAGVTSLTVAARAADDSANLGTTPDTRAFAVTGPNSLFGARTPQISAVADPDPVQVGVKFTPQVAGTVTGVRFFKGPGNGGQHTGSLWNATGTRLASATFTGETATGWQALSFADPVEVHAGTTYIASYHAPQGHYSSSPYFFAYRDHVAGPLRAPRSTVDAGNGVFRYGGEASFPDGTWNSANYHVDVLFTDSASTAPAVLSTVPATGAGNVAVGAPLSAKFSKPMTPSSLTFTVRDSAGASVAGAVGYDADSRTVTFTPAGPLALSEPYTATVDGADAGGTDLVDPATWTFTTDRYAQVLTMFAANAVPANPAVADGSPVELGTRFTPGVAGKVIGLRFYRGPGNNGTHVGSLWSDTGTLLARVTFGPPTGTGWQYARFADPVDVLDATSYVVSYHAPTGGYAATNNFFTDPWTNGPLTGPAGANGRYGYGGNAFPTNSWQSTNYWVDPLFVTAEQTVPEGPSSSLFADADVPTHPSWDEAATVELGVRFSTDVDGRVKGVRFYKGAQNTGVHTGSLWTSGGQLLATGTFTGETATGWQTLTFADPVRITPGAPYVASYKTTTGYYATTVNRFASSYDQVPLHVPASGGAYRYGGGFPASAAPHDYGVDVVFTADGGG